MQSGLNDSSGWEPVEPPFRLTIARYMQLMRNQIILEGGPIELIGGMLIAKDRSAEGESPLSVGVRHCYAVQAFQEWHTAAHAAGAHLRMQSPVEIEPYDSPEPDGMLLRGELMDYAHRHPGPEDVPYAFEVADHSLPFDLGTKLRLYARSGLPHYIVIDVRRRQVIHFQNPDREQQQYGKRDKLGPHDSIELRLPLGTVEMQLTEFFVEPCAKVEEAQSENCQFPGAHPGAPLR